MVILIVSGQPTTPYDIKMVITPDEAKKLNAAQEKEVADLEAMIDGFLRGEWDGQSDIVLPLAGYKLPQLKVQRKVADDYAGAGWKGPGFSKGQNDEAVYKMHC